MNVPTRRTVVAVVDRADREGVVAAATDRAAADDATLIVLAVDTAHAFSDARPTWWSAEGQRAAYAGALTPVQLELLGQHDLAMAVQRARRAGVDTYGWLPAQRGAAGVARYAREQHPDVVVVGHAHLDLTRGLGPDVVTA
jgi:nucleotide-binding universal stress UspA family protein